MLLSGVWFSLGDWFHEYFFLEINLAGAVLETHDGRRKNVDWAIPLQNDPPPENGRGCLLLGANLGDLCGFLCARQGLNSFIPSGIDLEIDGFFPEWDWAALLDRICRETGVVRTRRGDNVVFSIRDQAYLGGAETIKSIHRKNENLASFLQNIAEVFNMELVLDEQLEEVKINIQVQDQPWDEVLDCLSILNGFSWTLIRDTGGGPTKLLIQAD